MEYNTKLADKLLSVLPFLTEAQKRIYLASEAESLGYGGKAKVQRITGASPNTLKRGMKELSAGMDTHPQKRIRKKGGGRKKAITPKIWTHIESLIEPGRNEQETESPFQWISLSLRDLEAAMKKIGYKVSHRIIGDVLKESRFYLQSNRKKYDVRSRKEREKQYDFICRKAKDYIRDNQPVIALGARVREVAETHQNIESAGYSSNDIAYELFTGANDGIVTSGRDNAQYSKGWKGVRLTKIDADFAIQSLKNWWYKMGIERCAGANSLFITADFVGGNNESEKLWKHRLQILANETGLKIEIAHLPDGTYRWNVIEQRLFSTISCSRIGEPLKSYEVMIQFIASKISAKCLGNDENPHTKGNPKTGRQKNKNNIMTSSLYDEWNCSFHPK